MGLTRTGFSQRAAIPPRSQGFSSCTSSRGRCSSGPVSISALSPASSVPVRSTSCSRARRAMRGRRRWTRGATPPSARLRSCSACARPSPATSRDASRRSATSQRARVVQRRTRPRATPDGVSLARRGRAHGARGGARRPRAPRGSGIRARRDRRACRPLGADSDRRPLPRRGRRTLPRRLASRRWSFRRAPVTTRRRLPRSRRCGMVFVPSVGGISHDPSEHTAWDDCVNGANVLLGATVQLALRRLPDAP